MLGLRRRAVMAATACSVLAATACDPLPPPSDQINVVYPAYADGSPVHEASLLHDRGGFAMVDPATRWPDRDSLWLDGEVVNLGGDDVYVDIREISNQGHVVGSRRDVEIPTDPDAQPSMGPRMPFLWIDGEWTHLPLGEGGIEGGGASVNDHGQVAGYVVRKVSDDEYAQGIVVWKDGEVIRPPAGSILDDPRRSPSVVGLSNEGHVVVSLGAPQGVVVWQVGGEVVDLDLGLGPGNTPVHAVNERGMVLVGRPSEGRAFLWHDGELTEIGPDGVFIQVSDLNVWGQVVGITRDTDGGRRIFIWYEGEMTWLETFGGSGPYPWPAAMNNWGQVVGNSYDEDGVLQAFLWQNGRIINLDELIDDPDIAGTTPVDINNNGQILGSSETSGRAVMWEADPLWPGHPDGL